MRALAVTVRTTLLATALLAGGRAIAAGPPLPVTTPQAAGFSPERLDRIETFFKSEIEAKRVPGAVVGIARDGNLVYLKAFGASDPVSAAPMQIDTVFALASMTKPMVAVGVLSLTEQGKLPLFSPLAKYFPAFADMKVGVKAPDGAMQLEPQARPIFIQDLLRHTSGLTYGGRPDTGSPVAALWPPGSVLHRMDSSTAFIDTITKLPLAYQPGTTWEYSESFDVLAAVLEKVTGQKLGDYLRQTVWAPLGMADMGFHVDDANRGRVAHPFASDPLTGKPQHVTTIEEEVRFECGGGCSLGTVPSYLRFGQMLLNGGQLDGVRVLSPHTVSLMTSNQLAPSIQNNVAKVEPHRAGYGFGLGVAVRMEPGLAAVPGSVGEFTWNGAYGTGFFVDPREGLVVVFGTAAPGDLRKYYREQVQDLVYGALVTTRAAETP